MYELIQNNLYRHVILDDNELELFKSKLIAKSYKKNALILQPGVVSTNTHFVNKGFLRLYEINEKGFEKNILFAAEEWWISDLYSFHSQKPGTLYLQALEDTEVFQLSKSNMEFLLLKIPKLERFWRILHINAFISQQERMMHMISKTAEERYLEFKKKYPTAELRISQKHIASFLAITPEFLSKMKSQMKS